MQRLVVSGGARGVRQVAATAVRKVSFCLLVASFMFLFNNPSSTYLPRLYIALAHFCSKRVDCTALRCFFSPLSLARFLSISQQATARHTEPEKAQLLWTLEVKLKPMRWGVRRIETPSPTRSSVGRSCGGFVQARPPRVLRYPAPLRVRRRRQQLQQRRRRLAAGRSISKLRRERPKTQNLCEATRWGGGGTSYKTTLLSSIHQHQQYYPTRG